MAAAAVACGFEVNAAAEVGVEYVKEAATTFRARTTDDPSKA